MVSDSVGVSAIETEQCREQEQEKEQEQEQEAEVEMERYVDMAYQRDGEEPTRWAFRTLGDVAAADAPTLPGAPLPFASGTFYPASEFRCIRARRCRSRRTSRCRATTSTSTGSASAASRTR